MTKTALFSAILVARQLQLKKLLKMSFAAVLFFAATKADAETIHRRYNVEGSLAVHYHERLEMKQQNRISGKITDQETGLPLPGVTITLKGSNVGTSSASDGSFSIDVPGNGILVITSIGYIDAEIPIENRSVINITLQPLTTGLSEVVVIGYGKQKKSDLTGSISQIKGDDLTHLATQRVDQALQGKASGVMVLNTDGAPGGNTTIRIRGMNSINGGNNALIVIDGLQGGDLNALNPNDIESIEILKDASATAIYGSEGANGVILITTKQGKSGKPQIGYNIEVGQAKRAKNYDLLSAADYAKNVNAVEMTRTGGGNIPHPIFSDAEIKTLEQTGGTDWVDLIYRSALIQNHQLSINGGTENIKYLVSAGYLDQQGIIINTDFKRFSLRANLDAKINKWARFGLNWNGVRSDGNSVLFGGSTDWPNNPVSAAINFTPALPVFDDDGNYSTQPLRYGKAGTWNPIANATEPLINNVNKNNNLIAYLEFQLAQGLTLRINGGTIQSESNNQRFFNTKTMPGSRTNGQGSVTNSQSAFYQNSNILTYDKEFNKHHLTFTGVWEQKYNVGYWSTINGQQFLVEETGINDLGGAAVLNSSSSKSERVVKSYLGRINYIFNDKYLLTGSFRADGSSVFGANHKWGYFPSGAVAWRAGQEDFIKDLNIFSDLKFRGSWGITGNQAISPYETLSRMESGNNYPYNGGESTDIGFQIVSAANPNLKWESTRETDIGVDLGFFAQRLTFTADYYHKTTKDLLMPRQIPSFTGLYSIIDNVGSIENKGWEFAVEAIPFSRPKFNWTSGFNISFNRTKVLELGDTRLIQYNANGSGNGTMPFSYLIVGQPFGQMRGFKYLGVWKESEAKEAADYGQLPGDPHYADLNNDGMIDISDTTLIGNALPKFIFGWNNHIRFKNFEFIIQIQGVKGNNIFNLTRIDLESSQGRSARILDRWTPQNQDSDIPGLIDGKVREDAQLVSHISLPGSGGSTTSRWVEDGSYARIKNLTISYNFNRSVLNRLRFNNLRLYLSATNLLTITKYSGLDPEVSSYTGNDAQLGTDYNNYPPSRVFTLGLNLTF